ncbi:MAG: tRNA pseudouridine(55) synthase TruB, partial [Leptolyngbyaceae bacterium]|nr:tRNA pseudouridine(55) synthase TruB [Leptolyngbyaceae bacterium]
TALRHLPQVHLEGAIARRWRMGQKIPMHSPPLEIRSASDASHPSSLDFLPAIVSVFEEGDRFLGVGEYVPLADGAAESVHSNDAHAVNPDSAHQTSESMLLRPRMVFVPV